MPTKKSSKPASLAKTPAPGRAQLEAAALAAATKFDGDRVIPMLNRVADDPALVGLLGELGYHKPLDAFVDLKKLGIGLCLHGSIDGKPSVTQVRFEIRRKWTGFARYPGRLPHGLSPDLKTVEAERVFADRAEGYRANDSWYAYRFADHQISMGFGKTLLETVFVLLRDD